MARRPKESILLPDLKELAASIEIPPQRGLKPVTAAFFDLAGSSAAKLSQGHREAVRAMISHNGVVTTIARRFDAEVVKELGDGVMAVFDDARDAVKCALNVAVAVRTHLGLPSRVGVASGTAQPLKIGRRTDYLGDTIDRAARIQAAALPGQVLIDNETYGHIRAFVPEWAYVRVGEPLELALRGIGQVSIREISTARGSEPKTSWAPTALWIDELGRPPLAQKARFLAGARDEVIELGAGLTTFADFFRAQPGEAFRDHVVALLKGGVRFRCVVADPSGPAARAYADDRGEPGYLHEISDAIEKLRAIANEISTLELAGSFEIYRHQHLPGFAATAVDIGETSPSELGRISVSHYLHGVSRAESPVLRFGALSNAGLYRRYWTAIRELVRSATPVATS